MYFVPFALTLNTMLANLPLAIAEELDASAVCEQVQRSGQARLLRNGAIALGHVPCRFDHLILT